MFWVVAIIAFVVIALAFALIGIKMFLKKDGKFERRCENEGSKMCVCGGRKCKSKGVYPNKNSIITR